jgi:nucleotide-binding universal stress UspA family protein
MRLLSLRVILVGTDLTPASDAAVRTGLSLTRGSGARLHVLHVQSGGDAASTEQVERAVRAAGGTAGEAHVDVVAGAAAPTLASLADELHASVVVVGRRSNAAISHAQGGTAYDVITRTRVPILAVTTALRLPIRTAVVAVDASQTARGALHVALSWASALRDRNASARPMLTALHVTSNAAASGSAVETRTLRHELEVLTRNAGTWADVDMSAQTIEHTDAATAIQDFIRDKRPDLVILGTRAREDEVSRLGSVAAAVTSAADVPVLLVPPAVWRTHANDIDYW